MSVTPTYRTFVTEQLCLIRPDIRSKSMFGGVGIYAGDLFFALIDDDAVYLKVDDSTRPSFEARGLEPFRPAGEGGEVMQYYQLPEEVLEDVEALRPWVDAAVEVARRKKTGKKRKR